MENKFLRLVSSPMMNATNIYRYSGIKLVESENLAEHTYETLMLGYIIISNIKRLCPSEDISLESYMHQALHHDLEESLTGDVARPLKYHNSDVKRELNKVAYEVSLEMYKDYFSEREFQLYWEDAKSGKEGFILRIVDMLTVAFKAVKEVRVLNNMYFMKVVKEVNLYLSEVYEAVTNQIMFGEKATQYLQDVVGGSREEIQRIYDQYKSNVDGLGIMERSIINGGR